MRTQPVARVPESAHDPRRDPSRASGALVRSIRRDALGLEAVDAALPVVPRHLVDAGVDDGGDAWHRERRLRDVRRDDDAAARRRAQREILGLGVERAVQRHDLDVAPDTRLQVRDRAANFSRARQKAEHLAVGRPKHFGGGVGDRLSRRICDLERMPTSRHVDHRTFAEEGRDGARVERCRHDDDAKIVAGEPGLPRQRNREVGVDAALVELVDDDGRERRQQRVALHSRGENAFGDDEQTRVGAEAPLEADLPADLAAERPPALGGNPRGNRARRHAPGLKQDDGTVGQERRRHACGLAGAWRGGHDGGTRSPDGVEDRIEERIDRQGDHDKDTKGNKGLKG